MYNVGNGPWDLFSEEKGLNWGRIIYCYDFSVQTISPNSLKIEYQAYNGNDAIDGIDGSVGSGRLRSSKPSKPLKPSKP